MNKSQHVSSDRPLKPNISELKLIRFSQHGDRDAFACLYDTYIERIHHYIYYRVYDREVAEDLTSLVFLRVWENLGTFKSGQAPFMGWLYRIAHNAVIDYYRTRKPFITLEDVDPQSLSHSDRVDESIDLTNLSQKLVTAMDGLTGTQREVLILQFILGPDHHGNCPQAPQGTGCHPCLANARPSETGRGPCHSHGPSLWVGTSCLPQMADEAFPD